MKLLIRLVASALIGLGGVFLLVAVLVPFDRSESPEERTEIILGCLLIGVPTTTAGGWLLWKQARTAEKQTRDRLYAVFFRILRENEGYINVMQFSMAAHISGDAAKEFLDEQAKEYVADFEVDDQGAMFYRFPLKRLEETPDWAIASENVDDSPRDVKGNASSSLESSSLDESN